MFHQQLRITKILASGALLTMELKDAQFKAAKIHRIGHTPEIFALHIGLYLLLSVTQHQNNTSVNYDKAHYL